jgi:predicted HicB family RNase H-like nuclease
MQATISVRLKATLHKALRAKAKQNGQTISYLLNKLVEDSLAAQPQPEQPKG